MPINAISVTAKKHCFHQQHQPCRFNNTGFYWWTLPIQRPKHSLKERRTALASQALFDPQIFSAAEDISYWLQELPSHRHCIIEFHKPSENCFWKHTINARENYTDKATQLDNVLEWFGLVGVVLEYCCLLLCLLFVFEACKQPPGANSRVTNIYLSILQKY